MRRTVEMLTALALAGTASACSGTDGGRAAPTTTRPVSTTLPIDADGVVAGAHDCVPRDPTARGGARVAWDRLRNPIFTRPHMVKDQAVRLAARWHLYYSARTAGGSARAASSHATSADLARWDVDPGPDRWSSPDITRARDGRYVLTFQQADATQGNVDRIFVRTAADPGGPWSAPAPLVPNVAKGERTIDGALAHTAHGVFAIFKTGARESLVQRSRVVHSPSGSLGGPWTDLGETNLPWSENFQFVPIDGVWHVLVTTIPIHRPVLYRLQGDPSRPRNWRRWRPVRPFDIPAESWNRGETPGITHETANSAYLCDARALDGYWYLFYAGSTELTTFDGRGHAKIGVARSRDLVRWATPPG